MLMRVLRALLPALVGGFSAHAAMAEPVADFYQGKTVTLVVSSSPGGGYDTLARTVAKYLGNHLPGAPTIVVKNMPGAGGIVATNFMFNNAPKDGTVIGGMQNNTPFEPLIGTKEAKYDATKFNWLGSPSVEVGILAVWHTSPVNTLADARAREVTVGSSGVNSTPSFYARLLNETIGTKLKIIVGYPGQTEAFLAMERGEIDGYPSVFYSTLMSTKPTWIKEKKIKLLVQYGLEKEPELADVPFAPDLVTNADDKLLLQAGFAPLAIGRPYLMPPDVPRDRVEAMRAALAATFRDPAFLKEAEALSLGVNAPRSGEQIEAFVAKTYQTPPQIVERLRKLSAAK